MQLDIVHIDANGDATTANIIDTKGDSDMTTKTEQLDGAIAEATKTEGKAKTPPKKAAKPKATTKAKAAPKPKANPKGKGKEKPEAPAKPDPVTFKGYELAEGETVKDVEDMVAIAEDALGAIESKDSDLLTCYLNFGGFQAQAAKMFKSTKLYGQFLKAELPASQRLDAALRSNCKWLWEALNVADHEASELLTVLGVNRIEDFKSGNPTVIKREFKAATKKAAALEKAKAEGIEAGDEEATIKAVSEAEKAAAAKDEEKAVRAALRVAKKALSEHEDAADAVEEALDFIKEVLTRSKADAIEYLKSIK